jgi:hypothetical protein
MSLEHAPKQISIISMITPPWDLTLDRSRVSLPMHTGGRRDKNDKGLLPMRSLSKPDCVCHGFPQVLAVVQSLSESLQKDNANKKNAASSN